MLLDITIDWIPLWFAHILRGICILVGPFCMILSFRLATQSNLPRHRKFVYGGVFFMAASGVYTQIERWNLPVTPRLFVITPGILLVFIGLWSMRNYKSRDI